MHLVRIMKAQNITCQYQSYLFTLFLDFYLGFLKKVRKACPTIDPKIAKEIAFARSSNAKNYD